MKVRSKIVVVVVAILLVGTGYVAWESQILRTTSTHQSTFPFSDSNPLTPNSIPTTTLSISVNSPNSEVTEEDPRVRDGKGLFGRYWRKNAKIKVDFDRYYELAQQGDASAKVNLFEVIERCRTLIGLKGEADIESMLHRLNDPSSPAVVQIVKSVRYRMEDCNYIFSHQPESMKFDEWETRLLSDAVESGNTIAKLIVLDREPSNKQNYMERSRLLDNAIRTGNPIAYAQAASFAADYKRPDVDPDSLHLLFWTYMACQYDPECDLDEYIKNNTSSWLPWQFQLVVNASERFKKRLKDPTPIEFKLLLISPFELVDGSIWFEARSNG